MTHVVRIDTDGSVHRLEGAGLIEVAPADLKVNGYPGFHGVPPGWAADNMIDEDDPTVDVISAWRDSPAPQTGGVLVLAVHQWGRFLDMPVNVKGWSLYGRSPLVGPVYAALDSRDPLPDAWIEAIDQSPKWIDTVTWARMYEVAHAEGLVIP